MKHSRGGGSNIQSLIPPLQFFGGSPQKWLDSRVESRQGPDPLIAVKKGPGPDTRPVPSLESRQCLCLPRTPTRPAAWSNTPHLPPNFPFCFHVRMCMHMRSFQTPGINQRWILGSESDVPLGRGICLFEGLLSRPPGLSPFT